MNLNGTQTFAAKKIYVADYQYRNARFYIHCPDIEPLPIGTLVELFLTMDDVYEHVHTCFVFAHTSTQLVLESTANATINAIRYALTDVDADLDLCDEASTSSSSLSSPGQNTSSVKLTHSIPQFLQYCVEEGVDTLKTQFGMHQLEQPKHVKHLYIAQNNLYRAWCCYNNNNENTASPYQIHNKKTFYKHVASYLNSPKKLKLRHVQLRDKMCYDLTTFSASERKNVGEAPSSVYSFSCITSSNDYNNDKTESSSTSASAVSTEIDVVPETPAFKHAKPVSKPFNRFSCPTVYNNVQFRSKLEARFALVLTELNIDFRYEHLMMQAQSMRYTPDFFLPSQQLYVEIKPCRPHIEEELKCELLSQVGLLVVCMYGTVGVPFQNEGKRGYYHANTMRGMAWYRGKRLVGEVVFVVGRHPTDESVLEKFWDGSEPHLDTVSTTTDMRWNDALVINTLITVANTQF